MGSPLTFSGLPPSCPPVPRDSSAVGPVYRVLNGGAVATAYDWLSHEQRGQTLPTGMDRCRFASLSLFKNTAVVRKYKNLRHLTHAAELNIPADVGAHKTKGDHVDFWCADGEALSAHVTQIVSI